MSTCLCIILVNRLLESKQIQEWVFNPTTEMDAQGRIIAMADRKFDLIEGDAKLP